MCVFFFFKVKNLVVLILIFLLLALMSPPPPLPIIPSSNYSGLGSGSAHPGCLHCRAQEMVQQRGGRAREKEEVCYPNKQDTYLPGGGHLVSTVQCFFFLWGIFKRVFFLLFYFFAVCSRLFLYALSSVKDNPNNILETLSLLHKQSIESAPPVCNSNSLSLIR